MIPKVTIIVPVYNVEKHIKRCAVSLFEQTFEDIEYIFVNDCTPDKSFEVLSMVIELYPLRKSSISIINIENNIGLAAARNKGLKVAKGAYILHIDSDDYVEFDMVECMYNKAIQTNADIVVCDFFVQWKIVNKIAVQKYAADGINYTKMLLSGEVMPCVWNKLIKKTLYDNTKIISIEGIDMGEDYVLTTRLAFSAKIIAKVDSPFYHYVQTNANAYTKNYSQKSVNSLIKAINVLNDFFKEKKDYDLFHIPLLQGKLRKKIFIIMSSPYNERKIMINIYPESNAVLSITNLLFKEKVTLFLFEKKHYLVLRIFLVLISILTEFFQFLKGRRF